MPFDGLRVLALESRRATEIETLIRLQGGVPFVAPSMREVPLAQNSAALAFAEDLFQGKFDMMILLTGVGTRLLNQVIETRWPTGAFAEALRGITIVARGPKPMAVMREWGVTVAVMVPEPNTWREILAATEGRPEKRVAVQEYGRPSRELIDGLRARGADVTSVQVYQWDLPEDLAPLREAVRRLARGEIDVLLVTSSSQVEHLLKVAAELGLEDEIRRACERVVMASIGPTTSETLAELGFRADFEPSRPKMGLLVNESAQQARQLLQSKQ
ncbi:MAG TPA: uroporphyrinogen-III synthase [Bryobacteraceae bacterium]|nr:uroporphyrinogen-III synthase [Bryobacteraceae bacterium]